jgi:hypothetical protein
MVVNIEPVYHRNVSLCWHSCMSVLIEPVHPKETFCLWAQLYVCTNESVYHRKSCCIVDTVACVYLLTLCITKEKITFVLWIQL